MLSAESVGLRVYSIQTLSVSLGFSSFTVTDPWWSPVCTRVSPATYTGHPWLKDTMCLGQLLPAPQPTAQLGGTHPGLTCLPVPPHLPFPFPDH